MNPLIPVKFPEANRNLGKPGSMSDSECKGLWVYTDGEQCVSRWRLTLWQRLKLLFTGHIWLSVLSGHTQPPVWLDCSNSIFNEK